MPSQGVGLYLRFLLLFLCRAKALVCIYGFCCCFYAEPRRWFVFTVFVVVFTPSQGVGLYLCVFTVLVFYFGILVLSVGSFTIYHWFFCAKNL